MPLCFFVVFFEQLSSTIWLFFCISMHVELVIISSLICGERALCTPCTPTSLALAVSQKGPEHP